MTRDCPSCGNTDLFYIEEKLVSITYDILREKNSLLTVESNPCAKEGREKTSIQSFFKCKVCEKKWPMLSGVKVKQEEFGVGEDFYSAEDLL